MTDEELVQFEALAKKFEPKDKDKVKDIVQTHVHPVFQEINDGGRSAGVQAQKGKVTEAENKAKEAADKVVALQQQLDELNGKAPDAAKLREKYEAETKRQREEYEAKLSGKDNQLLAERRGRATADFSAKLIAAGVDPDYATTILANRADVVERIEFDKDGTCRVLKAGSKDVPVVPATGKTPIDHLVEELVPTIDAKWLKSGVRRGSNVSGGSGGPTGGARYETIRTEMEQRNKTATEQRKQDGLQRLRGGP